MTEEIKENVVNSVCDTEVEPPKKTDEVAKSSIKINVIPPKSLISDAEYEQIVTDRLQHLSTLLDLMKTEAEKEDGGLTSFNDYDHWEEILILMKEDLNCAEAFRHKQAIDPKILQGVNIVNMDTLNFYDIHSSKRSLVGTLLKAIYVAITVNRCKEDHCSIEDIRRNELNVINCMHTFEEAQFKTEYVKSNKRKVEAEIDYEFKEAPFAPLCDSSHVVMGRFEGMCTKRRHKESYNVIPA